MMDLARRRGITMDVAALSAHWTARSCRSSRDAAKGSIALRQAIDQAAARADAAPADLPADAPTWTR